MMSTTTPRRKKPATTAVIAISALMAGITAAESAFAQQVAPRNRRASASQGPIVNRVVVEGNKKIESAAFQDQFQARARAPYNQAAVDADVVVSLRFIGSPAAGLPR